MARGLKFGFRKQKDCTIYVAKTKVPISCATAQLICVFVFAFAKSRFSHNEAHIIIYINWHNRRADKNPYLGDHRADSQCLHKNLKLLFFPIGGKTTLFFFSIELVWEPFPKCLKNTEY